jgi:hypothetical protein
MKQITVQVLCRPGKSQQGHPRIPKVEKCKGLALHLPPTNEKSVLREAQESAPAGAAAQGPVLPLPASLPSPQPLTSTFPHLSPYQEPPGV